MGDVIQFKRPQPAARHQGKTLCANGHHRWKVVTGKQFDVKQGRLVTVYRCSRCGQQKTKAL